MQLIAEWFLKAMKNSSANSKELCLTSWVALLSSVFISIVHYIKIICTLDFNKVLLYLNLSKESDSFC